MTDQKQLRRVGLLIQHLINGNLGARKRLPCATHSAANLDRIDTKQVVAHSCDAVDGAITNRKITRQLKLAITGYRIIGGGQAEYDVKHCLAVNDNINTNGREIGGALLSVNQTIGNSCRPIHTAIGHKITLVAQTVFTATTRQIGLVRA